MRLLLTFFILTACYSAQGLNSTSHSHYSASLFTGSVRPFDFQLKATLDSYKRDLNNICKLVILRERHVDVALLRSVPKHPHPLKLPANVYHGKATDLWSQHSTARLDNLIRKRAVELYNLVLTSSSRINFIFGQTQQLHNHMFDQLTETSENCQVKVTHYDGHRSSIKLHEILSRLPELSFDPMHCPEYRWGDYSPYCDEKVFSKDWHEAQRRLRYLTWHPKNFGGLTAEDLFYTTFTGQRQLPENPPKTDIYKLLRSKIK